MSRFRVPCVAVASSCASLSPWRLAPTQRPSTEECQTGVHAIAGRCVRSVACCVALALELCRRHLGIIWLGLELQLIAAFFFRWRGGLCFGLAEAVVFHRSPFVFSRF